MSAIEYMFRRRNRQPQHVARSASFSEFSEPLRELLADFVNARSTIPIRVEELPGVVATRTLIADAISQCPLVHLGTDNRPVRSPSPIVLQPDPHEAPITTHNRHAMDLTGDGNIWLQVTARNSRTGGAVAVQILPANEVQPIEHPDTWRVLGCRYQGRDLFVDTGDVVHLPMYVLFDQRRRVGLSALRLSRPAMEGIAEIYGYARSVWAEGGAPSVILTVPQEIGSKEEAADIRERWTSTHGGRRVPAIMSGGASVQAFAPVDDVKKLAEAVEIIAADAPNAYRTPPSLVNAHSAGASLTYSTTADEVRRWHRLCLTAYMSRIEWLYSAALPHGHHARFDTSELLRGDPVETAKLTSQALGGQPWREVNEERQARGLPPMGQQPAIAPNVIPHMDGS